MVRNIIIIGSGPAGLTAAIYASRANLNPLVVEGSQPGGQLTITTQVENYPGFPDGIMGPQLMMDMKRQAERLGTEFVNGDVISVNLSKRPFVILVGEENNRYEARALIIAVGASARLLNLESERRLMGKGVSVCATCDGFFFKGQEVMVIGGGDTALEEAILLTKFARKVTVIHRRDRLRATKALQDKAFKNEKMDFIWNSVVEDILGVEEDKVTGIRLRNVETLEITEKGCDGVFIAIGHTPNTRLFNGQIELDDKGYIITRDGMKTSVPGVFAAGDVQDHVYRQAVTAAGTGCMAAIDAERFIESESIYL
ncbi:MAG: thioredoxin-disulfide reductase [Nitrospinae bacterium]|nr:thioredoxin-disulfide reductase [Nitrospinota bacterium]